MIYMIMLLICDNHFVRVCVYVCVCVCVCVYAMQFCDKPK